MVSGKLVGYRRWRNGSGQDFVSLRVRNHDEVDLIPGHPLFVGYVWKERPQSPNRHNIPIQHVPLLNMRLHGGPRDGTVHTLGWDDEWDGKPILFQDLGVFAHCSARVLPEGVERPPSDLQRRHGYGPTVYVGEVDMHYMEDESNAMNARRVDMP